MTNDQIMALADIQRMSIAGRDQTGRSIVHDVTAFPDGGLFSNVRVLGANVQPLHSTFIGIHEDGREYGQHDDPDAPRTLSEQRLALAKWIAANRMQEDAA
jgi:hypothetical protein